MALRAEILRFSFSRDICDFIWVWGNYYIFMGEAVNFFNEVGVSYSSEIVLKSPETNQRWWALVKNVVSHGGHILRSPGF